MPMKKTIRQIEGIVCSAVLASYKDTYVPCIVSPDTIYKGKRCVNIPRPLTTARHFCYYALHEIANLSYKEIAEHSGMGIRGIFKRTKQIKNLIGIDPLYASIYKTIKEECDG